MNFIQYFITKRSFIFVDKFKALFKFSSNMDDNDIQIEYGYNKVARGIFLRVYDLRLALAEDSSATAAAFNQVIEQLFGRTGGVYLNLFAGSDSGSHPQAIEGRVTVVTNETMAIFLDLYGVPQGRINELLRERESDKRFLPLPLIVFERIDKWFGHFSTRFNEAVSDGKALNKIGGGPISKVDAIAFRYLVANIFTALEGKFGSGKIKHMPNDIKMYTRDQVSSTKPNFAVITTKKTIKFSNDENFFKALRKKIEPNASHRATLPDNLRTDFRDNFAKVIIPGTFNRDGATGVNFFMKISDEWEFEMNYQAVKKFFPI